MSRDANLLQFARYCGTDLQFWYDPLRCLTYVESSSVEGQAVSIVPESCHNRFSPFDDVVAHCELHEGGIA